VGGSGADNPVMHKIAAVAVTAAALTVVLNGGVSLASGGSSSGGSGSWPAAYPLPTSPGVVTAQSGSAAVVRSTDTVATVQGKLDALYVTQKGCKSRVLVNKPVDYLCYNSMTRKTDEVWFTFAALDPKPADPSRSQTNGYYVKG